MTLEQRCSLDLDQSHFIKKEEWQLMKSFEKMKMDDSIPFTQKVECALNSMDDTESNSMIVLVQCGKRVQDDIESILKMHTAKLPPEAQEAMQWARKAVYCISEKYSPNNKQETCMFNSTKRANKHIYFQTVDVQTGELLQSPLYHYHVENEGVGVLDYTMLIHCWTILGRFSDFLRTVLEHLFHASNADALKLAEKEEVCLLRSCNHAARILYLYQAETLACPYALLKHS